MEDFVHTKEQTTVKPQNKAGSSIEFGFEEDLKRQNIKTMIEIYGEEYMKKIESLTQ